MKTCGAELPVAIHDDGNSVERCRVKNIVDITAVTYILASKISPDADNVVGCDDIAARIGAHNRVSVAGCIRTERKDIDSCVIVALSVCLEHAGSDWPCYCCRRCSSREPRYHRRC